MLEHLPAAAAHQLAAGGALLGATRGESALPERWRQALLSGRSQRGLAYQTGDAPSLAEALWRAGQALG